jgi:hypothetical protein
MMRPLIRQPPVLPATLRRGRRQQRAVFARIHTASDDLACFEPGVLSSQRPDQSIADQQPMIGEISVCEDRRNRDHTKADRQSTKTDARMKQTKPYQSL